MQTLTVAMGGLQIKEPLLSSRLDCGLQGGLGPCSATYCRIQPPCLLMPLLHGTQGECWQSVESRVIVVFWGYLGHKQALMTSGRADQSPGGRRGLGWGGDDGRGEVT